jgi:hypothetical protein
MVKTHSTNNWIVEDVMANRASNIFRKVGLKYTKEELLILSLISSFMLTRGVVDD